MGFDQFETVTVEEICLRRPRVSVFTPRGRAHSGQIYGSQRKRKNRILNREKLEQEAQGYGLSADDLMLLRAIEAGDIITAQKKHQDDISRASKRNQSKSFLW